MKRVVYLFKKSINIIKTEGFNVFLQKFKNYILGRILNQNKKYKRYIKENILDNKKKELIRKNIQTLSYKPLISIITPVYNINPKIFRKTINSVLNQIYENWEMCICDDGSSNKKIVDYLKSIEGVDKRIKILYSKKNEGISVASNKALSIANGEYIAFLDHDDTIEPNALYEIVKLLNHHSDADLIYTDEARIDMKDRIINIEFKPDFSRYFYLSHPYIVHLVVIKRELIDKVKGFDEINFKDNVSCDVDLFLRVFAITEDRKIYHIPKVLYYWRINPLSVGSLCEEKVHKNTKFAINRYLENLGISGWAEDGLTFNTFRVRFKIEKNPLVSIIIPTKNNWMLLQKCLKSIEDLSGYKNYEIIIVSNNTQLKEANEYLNRMKNKYQVIYYNVPYNYSLINNYAKRFSKGEYLLFLNDDIEFINKNWLLSMLELFQINDVGVVGGKLIFPDKKIQHAGVIIGLVNGIAEHWHKFIDAFIGDKFQNPGYLCSLNSIREYSAVTGACLMVRKKIFESVGEFPEDMPYGYNDIDLCLRIRKSGYRVLFTPYVFAYHYESSSRKNLNNPEILYHPKDSKLFYKKWENFIKNGDPYYNPNLSLKNYIPIPKLNRESL